MGLDVERTNIGYLLGRWLAVAEKIQKEKLGTVNCSFKDKYFKSLGTTPLAVFPQVSREVHSYKARTYLMVMFDEILNKVDGNVPKKLTQEEQGEFVIGYSHQRFSLYTKKEIEEEIAEGEEIEEDVEEEDSED